MHIQTDTRLRHNPHGCPSAVPIKAKEGVAPTPPPSGLPFKAKEGVVPTPTPSRSPCLFSTYQTILMQYVVRMLCGVEKNFTESNTTL